MHVSRLILAFLLSSSLLLMPACGGGGGGATPAPAPEPPPPRAAIPIPLEPSPPVEPPPAPLDVPLDTSFLDLGTPGTATVEVEGLAYTPNTVTIDPADILREPSANVLILSATAGVAEGDILYRPHQNRFDRVVAVERLADIGALHVSLAPATMDELIDGGSIAFDVSPDWTGSEPAGAPARMLSKVAPSGAPYALKDGAFRIESYELFRLETDDVGRLLPGSHVAGIDAARITSRMWKTLPKNGRVVASIENLEIHVRPRIEGAFEYGLRGISSAPTWAWTRSQALVTYKGELRLDGDKHFDLDFERALFSAKPILINTAPPILFHLDVTAGIEADIDLHGAFSLKFHGQQSVRYDATYRHGQGIVGKPIADAKAIYQDSTLEFEGEATANASVTLFIEAKAMVSLAGLVGPYVAVRPTATGQLRLPLRDGDPEFILTVSGRAGLSGTRTTGIADLGNPWEFLFESFAIDVLKPAAGASRREYRNSPPAIGLHAVVAPRDMSIDIPLHASDLDGDSLVWEIARHGDLGTSELLYDGGATLRYTPSRGKLGDDVVRVRVRDAHGASAEADVTIKIEKGRAPQAEFDFEYRPDRWIKLDASASVDAEDVTEDLLYRWSYYGDKSWSTWTKSPTASLRYPTSATRVVILEVKDTHGMTSKRYRKVSTGFFKTKSTLESAFVEIAAGARHVLARTRSSLLYAWGDNDRGQLATGKLGPDAGSPLQIKSLRNVTAIGAGFDTSHATVSGYTPYGWGDTGMNKLTGTYPRYTKLTRPTVMTGMGRIVQWGAGYNHTLGVTFDGGLVGVGDQGEGQLGINPNPRGSSRLAIPRRFYEGVVKVTGGGEHTIALDRDGVLLGWGENDDGVLAGGNTDDPVSVRVIKGEYGNLPKMVDVSTAWDHAVAADRYGGAWSWGDNGNGKLALDNNRIGRAVWPKRVPGLSNVVSVAAGHESSFFIVARGSERVLYAAGENDYGQLGDGTFEDRYAPVRVKIPARIIQVVAGENFAAALDDRGYVWAWGRNRDGQLGDGTFENRSVPVRVGRIDD